MSSFSIREAIKDDIMLLPITFKKEWQVSGGTLCDSQLKTRGLLFFAFIFNNLFFFYCIFLLKFWTHILYILFQAKDIKVACSPASQRGAKSSAPRDTRRFFFFFFFFVPR